MADKALMDKLDNAIQVVNNLSRDAKAAGESEMMYAANRAWHQLSNARARTQSEKRVSEEMVEGFRKALIQCNCTSRDGTVVTDSMMRVLACFTAALSDQVETPKPATGIVRRVGWMFNKDVDPGNDDAEKFLGVVIEYPNEPPDFSPSIVWAKPPVKIVVIPAASTPVRSS